MSTTDSDNKKKRSLILAGGGMKVAFQAGVLQVWLDEAGISFDHADGVSGGTFNLAMYCQGMTGHQIADNWRNLPVSFFKDFNWEQYTHLFYANSILKFDRFREQIFPDWGLDWDIIKASKLEATFNVYNFSAHELEILTPDMMTENYLVACASIPMWFPPVIIDENIYIDAVFITDANLEEAIRRGADELWVVWTVSEKSQWNNGFIANYFQIIETCANGQFKRMLYRIERNNSSIAAGKAGEFGRHIEMKILQAEVPLHYLVNLSTDRIQESVNLGVERGRQWCVEQGIQLNHSIISPQPEISKLSFIDEFGGFIAFGETDYELGYKKGKESGTSLMLQLSIHVDDVDRFITDPEHVASAVGYIKCEELGGNLPLEKGIFNLFKDEANPTRKRMIYRLYFRDGAGHPLTLSGYKLVQDNPGSNVWHDTTTLFVKMLQGHVNTDDEMHAELVGSGILQVTFLDFLKQLTTFRVESQNLLEKPKILARFGEFFLGALWDSYGQHIFSYGPF
jgi:predicted acylesterase/phospholipase RssA